jgi:glucosylceramidase
LREYSYADDLIDDFDLNSFALQDEDLKWKIPFVKAAFDMSKKKISLFASAWTAPKWMKTNNDFKGNGTLKEPIGGKYYQTWANYYLRFFQSYQEHNLTFWAMTGTLNKFNLLK